MERHWTHVPGDDRNKEASKNKEYADLVQVRHGSVEETHQDAGNPCDYDVRHENMPWLKDVIRILKSVPNSYLASVSRGVQGSY